MIKQMDKINSKIINCPYFFQLFFISAVVLFFFLFIFFFFFLLFIYLLTFFFFFFLNLCKFLSLKSFYFIFSFFFLVWFFFFLFGCFFSPDAFPSKESVFQFFFLRKEKYALNSYPSSYNVSFFPHFYLLISFDILPSILFYYSILCMITDFCPIAKQ